MSNPVTPVKITASHASIKKELHDIREADSSPISNKTATTTEAVSTNPDYDDPSDLSDNEDNIPKFK
ncbi:MAG: hypothetical protein P1U36_02940 [Legionellaceae bacterium]|nr:hypothetical protein [Legionellaceae bacterium]